MTIFVERFYADLFVANFVEQTIADSHVENALEIFCKSQQSLVSELVSAAEVFCVIAAMKTHVKPLNLQCSIGDLDVSLWEHLHNTHHLFKPMEMVHWQD